MDVDSFLARTKISGQPVLCDNALELMSKLLLESLMILDRIMNFDIFAFLQWLG